MGVSYQPRGWKIWSNCRSIEQATSRYSIAVADRGRLKYLLGSIREERSLQLLCTTCLQTTPSPNPTATFAIIGYGVVHLQQLSFRFRRASTCINYLPRRVARMYSYGCLRIRLLPQRRRSTALKYPIPKQPMHCTSLDLILPIAAPLQY